MGSRLSLVEDVVPKRKNHSSMPLFFSSFDGTHHPLQIVFSFSPLKRKRKKKTIQRSSSLHRQLRQTRTRHWQARRGSSIRPSRCPHRDQRCHHHVATAIVSGDCRTTRDADWPSDERHRHHGRRRGHDHRSHRHHHHCSGSHGRGGPVGRSQSICPRRSVANAHRVQEDQDNLSPSGQICRSCSSKRRVHFHGHRRHGRRLAHRAAACPWRTRQRDVRRRPCSRRVSHTRPWRLIRHCIPQRQSRSSYQPDATGRIVQTNLRGLVHACCC